MKIWLSKKLETNPRRRSGGAQGLKMGQINQSLFIELGLKWAFFIGPTVSLGGCYGPLWDRLMGLFMFQFLDLILLHTFRYSLLFILTLHICFYYFLFINISLWFLGFELKKLVIDFHSVQLYNDREIIAIT